MKIKNLIKGISLCLMAGGAMGMGGTYSFSSFECAKSNNREYRGITDEELEGLDSMESFKAIEKRTFEDTSISEWQFGELIRVSLEIKRLYRRSRWTGWYGIGDIAEENLDFAEFAGKCCAEILEPLEEITYVELERIRNFEHCEVIKRKRFEMNDGVSRQSGNRIKVSLGITRLCKEPSGLDYGIGLLARDRAVFEQHTENLCGKILELAYGELMGAIRGAFEECTSDYEDIELSGYEY